ncbi:peptidoglycan-associated lipoprotein Pal [Pararobbsia alpina]|uniref:Peptidoglycan-associated lipoprotein n=1 Tax=Pararobbsia alpina TaxID=621374 RepID=A0A6S7B9G7_9BURK|nr:peptidoglycan-associated lipoprotein Pal [Pararobbsia alpina]CAB3792703.1 Peptidoglycan-associated lipoprotein [Pararobbsia alpina]
MKKSRFSVLAIAVCTLALTACHSKVSLDEKTAPASSASASQDASLPGAAAPGVAVSAPGVQTDALHDPASPLSRRSFYFDLDSYAVNTDDRSTLTAHAKYLLSDPKRHLLIQGNTDERGTTEYNLALGQKRSEAVMRTLETLGVPDSQLEAVSFGKEKPLVDGHDEAAWSKNRRVDLVYVAH